VQSVRERGGRETQAGGARASLRGSRPRPRGDNQD
jgi:hypothetical protein